MLYLDAKIREPGVVPTYLLTGQVRELCLYYTALQVETHCQRCVAKDTGELLVALEAGYLPYSWGVSWS